MNDNLINKISVNGSEDGSSSEFPEQLRKYFLILYDNKYFIIILVAICIIVSFFYAKSLPNVYQSSIGLKIDKPKGNILEDLVYSDESKSGGIANQIALMKSYYVRDYAARMILDSVKNNPAARSWRHVTRIKDDKDTLILKEEELRMRLSNMIEFRNPQGLDIVEITLSGPIFKENLLIVSCYANAFLNYNLERSRAELTAQRLFLEEEKTKKLDELSIAESNLENFQKTSGIVNMDQAVQRLVNTSASLEAIKNATDIEIRSQEASLRIVRDELGKIDPEFNSYMDLRLNQPIFDEISKKIAGIEIDRDIELANITDELVRQRIIRDAENKIDALRKSYEEQVQILKAGLEANTPEQKKQIISRILDINLQIAALRNKYSRASDIEKNYLLDMKQLPTAVIDYAKLERSRKSAENLFNAIEAKFQEAVINERSRLGNVYIIDPGTDNTGPIGPNRPRILFNAVIMGFVLGSLFVFGKYYLDKTIKTPDEIEREGASVLSWIPNIDAIGAKDVKQSELIIMNSPKSAFAESFKALRTRVQFTKLEKDPLRTILITSSIPSEGKTIVSANLAGAYALDGKKVILLDCDLRKPRVHNLFGSERYPGLSDYLFSNVSLEDIVRPSGMENLSYITSGTLPPNPSELLGSTQMKDFLDDLKKKFDIIIIDSPPSISVTDAEILFTITDGMILICQAAKTDKQIFLKTYRKFYNMNRHNLLGCVLNNFKYKSSYGYYYNYYYYYSSPDDKRKKLQSSTKS